MQKGKIRPLRKCASPGVPVWVALKYSPPFGTMLLPSPQLQLVRRLLRRETKEEMSSYVSCCKVTVMPNAPPSSGRSPAGLVINLSELLHRQELCHIPQISASQILHEAMRCYTQEQPGRQFLLSKLHLWYHCTSTESFFPFSQIPPISKIFSAGSSSGESQHSSTEPLLKQFTPSEALEQKKNPSQWDISQNWSVLLDTNQIYLFA